MKLVPDADVLATVQRSGHAADVTALGPLPVVITDAVWDELTINAKQYNIHPSSITEIERMLSSIAGEATPILPQSAEARTLALLQAPPPSEGPGELSVIAYVIHNVESIPVLTDRRALRRAVEEIRRRILSLHGFIDVLRTEHGLPAEVADDISRYFCARNTPVRRPVWW